MQAQHVAPLGLKPTQLMLLLAQVVRAPVALAMVKLLKLLPEDVMVQQLPQALQGVAHLPTQPPPAYQVPLLAKHHHVTLCST